MRRETEGSSPSKMMAVVSALCGRWRSMQLAETLSACQREGFQECEASWVLENNEAVQRVIRIFGGQRYKTYRLYERAV